jgi:hypothetical protein
MLSPVLDAKGHTWACTLDFANAYTYYGHTTCTLLCQMVHTNQFIVIFLFLHRNKKLAMCQIPKQHTQACNPDYAHLFTSNADT